MRTLGIVAAAVAALVSAAAGLAAADPRNPLDVIEQLELAGTRSLSTASAPRRSRTAW